MSSPAPSHSFLAVGGWPIPRAALAGLRRRSLDMNVLMTLAAVGAVGIGSHAEGAWVLVLFAVGTTLESFAFDRSRRSIAELVDLAPEQARVLADDGSEHLVPVEEVTIGTRFLVRPGERIPLDGLVVDGASTVDEAPITGESVPVDKQPDSTVLAGTLNAHGALTVRTSSSAGESTLARVVALVRGGPGLARTIGAPRRPLRTRLHPARVRRRAHRRGHPRGARGQRGHVAVPGACAPDRGVPVLAGNGRTSPYEPADAIPAAARYLRASGAPGDYHAALFAYNHADWYVAEVLAKASAYRGGTVTAPLPQLTGTVDQVLRNPRIALTPIQRADLHARLIDPRVVSILAAIAQEHTIVITALRSDHTINAVDGNPSNHSAGRAVDIGAVDGETCRGTRIGRCAELVRELAAMHGPLRATELIYCWDPDGPADPRGFARADHCDHIHAGRDA